jgi:hypothetical protein
MTPAQRVRAIKELRLKHKVATAKRADFANCVNLMDTLLKSLEDQIHELTTKKRQP